MGELEYYIIAKKAEVSMDFPAVDQKGNHESNPFTKFDQLRKEAMVYFRSWRKIKYGHSEVGNYTDDNYYYEQNEIEFETDTLENSADRLLVAKWILRMLADQYGVVVSFAPKITVGKAGSGLHIHMKVLKDGKSVMVENGRLATLQSVRWLASLTLQQPSPLLETESQHPTCALYLTRKLLPTSAGETGTALL